MKILITQQGKIHNVWHPKKKKKSRHAENQENIIYKKEKNWTQPEQAQVLELANKDINAVIITVSHMFKVEWKYKRY